MFFDVAVYIFRCCTTYFCDVALHSFFHMFTLLHLKCFVIFGTGSGGGTRCVGKRDRGARWGTEDRGAVRTLMSSRGVE
jgi:hypothetical protein